MTIFFAIFVPSEAEKPPCLLAITAGRASKDLKQ